MSISGTAPAPDVRGQGPSATLPAVQAGRPGDRRRSGTARVPSARVELSDGRTFTILVRTRLGRRPVPTDGDVSLISVEDPSRSVSKTHLEITVDDTGTWVTDCRSTNGTVVTLADGQQVVCVPGHRVKLRPGARVSFGDCWALVLDDAPPAPDATGGHLPGRPICRPIGPANDRPDDHPNEQERPR